MDDELIDLVDRNDKVFGTVLKSKAHGNPDVIHREAAIVVVNDKGQVLLQQRSLSKKNDPGEWKLTAAGHVRAGEDPAVAVRREVFEELGIKVEPVYFKKVFRENIDKGKILESRFFWVYYSLVKDSPRLKLDPLEVSDAKWVEIRELEKFAESHEYELQSLSHQTIIEVAQKLKII